MQNISKLNSDGLTLKELCPNIRELDISKNLISSWKIVFLICEQLENLEWLNLRYIQKTHFAHLLKKVYFAVKIIWNHWMTVLATVSQQSEL